MWCFNLYLHTPVQPRHSHGGDRRCLPGIFLLPVVTFSSHLPSSSSPISQWPALCHLQVGFHFLSLYIHEMLGPVRISVWLSPQDSYFVICPCCCLFPYVVPFPCGTRFPGVDTTHLLIRSPASGHLGSFQDGVLAKEAAANIGVPVHSSWSSPQGQGGWVTLQNYGTVELLRKSGRAFLQP